jgi:hypothetical protein
MTVGTDNVSPAGFRSGWGSSVAIADTGSCGSDFTALIVGVGTTSLDDGDVCEVGFFSNDVVSRGGRVLFLFQAT